MSDPERLNEALGRVHHNEAWPMGLNTRVALGEVCEAARAYADLLANRVGPDYEAAAKAFHKAWFLESTNPDDPEDFYPELWDEMEQEDRDWYLATARLHVDAAIGDKLLINPPTEEG